MQDRNKRLFLYGLLTIYPILSLAQVNAAKIKLISGDMIHGKITDQNDTHLTFDHEDIGRISINKDRIDSITSDSEEEITQAEDANTLSELDKQAEPAPDANDLSSFGLLIKRLKEKQWRMSLDLSFTSDTGNTNEQTVRLGFRARQNREDTRFSTDLTYYHKISDNETRDNKLSWGFSKDWLIPKSRWFYFLAGRYDYDEFESWQHRAYIHTGPGYKLLNTEPLFLDIKAGLGPRKEWRSENNNIEWEGLLELDAQWNISKRQSLALSSGYFGVLSDTDDYRIRTACDWRYRLDNETNISLIVGILHEYLNVVDPGTAKNDTRIHTGIRFEF